MNINDDSRVKYKVRCLNPRQIVINTFQGYWRSTLVFNVYGSWICLYSITTCFKYGAFHANYWKFHDQSSMEEILTLLSYNKAENKDLIIYKNEWRTIWKYVIKHLTTLSMTSWYSRLNYLKISTTRKFIISTLQRLTRPSIVFIFYLISWYFHFFLTWQFHQDHFSFDKRKSERMVSN